MLKKSMLSLGVLLISTSAFAAGIQGVYEMSAINGDINGTLTLTAKGDSGEIQMTGVNVNDSKKSCTEKFTVAITRDPKNIHLYALVPNMSTYTQSETSAGVCDDIGKPSDNLDGEEFIPTTDGLLGVSVDNSGNATIDSDLFLAKQS